VCAWVVVVGAASVGWGRMNVAERRPGVSTKESATHGPWTQAPGTQASTRAPPQAYVCVCRQGGRTVGRDVGGSGGVPPRVALSGMASQNIRSPGHKEPGRQLYTPGRGQGHPVHGHTPTAAHCLSAWCGEGWRAWMWEGGWKAGHEHMPNQIKIGLGV